MKNLEPTIERFGDSGLRFKWQAAIDPFIHAIIVSYRDQIIADFGTHIEEITISYNELAIYLNDREKQTDLGQELSNLDLRQEFRIDQNKKEKVYIPVCYENEFSLDGEKLCNANDLSMDELIELHTAVEYPVYFIGFLPGFPYLGGLNKKLHHSRRSSPRKRVPKGAVGIAGAQTGIYPSSSPGGWNIIGQSPMPMFNPEDESAALLKSGDVIVFYSITKKNFKILERDFFKCSLNDLRKSSHKIYKEYHDRS